MLDGRELVDGGVVEPLPVDALRHHSRVPVDRVIAVNVIPTVADIERCHAAPPEPRAGLLHLLNRHLNVFAEGNLLNILRRSLLSSEIRLAEAAAARADVVVSPVVCEGTWYDFENFERYIELGRKHARAALPEILRLPDGETPFPHPEPP